MIRISQNDKRWKDKFIGDSHSTIGSQGCLITALAMIYSKFHPFSNFYSPEDASGDWKFNNNLLDWSTDFYGMEYVDRIWDYIPSRDDDLFKKYSNSEDYGVCIQVQTSSGVHWLPLIGKSVLGWATNDPWNGRRLWKTVGFGAPYKRVLGSVIFKKTSL